MIGSLLQTSRSFGMKRREFLFVPARGLGGLLVYSLAGEAIRLQAQEGVVQVPMRFFTAGEAANRAGSLRADFPDRLRAATAPRRRMWSSISTGTLRGHWGETSTAIRRYVGGVVPEHGYQGKENPQQIYRAGMPKLGRKPRIAPAQQDDRLRSIEKSTFFQLLRTHTIEGMFSDPLHGGNAGLIGWQLVGYPGAQMSYREEIDKHYGLPFESEPKTAPDGGS